MLDDDYSSNTRDQKGAEGSYPAIPDRAEQRWQNETHRDCEQMDVAMLEPDKRIFLQVGDVIEWRIGF